MKQLLFGTPLFQFHLKNQDLDKDLAKHYLEEAQQDIVGVPRSNSGGWHSKLFTDPYADCLKKFRAESFECFMEVLKGVLQQNWKTSWKQQSWAVINRRHDYNLSHCHAGSEWSSVYYVDAGESFDVLDPNKRIAHSGRIQFADPRGSIVDMVQRVCDRNMLYEEMFGASTISLIPYTGLLVFFPSYLMHTVLPYEGDKPRIVISTNYILEKAELLSQT